jgi:hypothetical protein
LAELQQLFIQDTLAATDHELFSSSRGKTIYRNQFYHARADALKKTYPLLLKLVGEEFFTALANDYSDQYPSHASDLNYFGDQLTLFLEHHPAVREFPYFAEVAQLEWACYQALVAENSEACQPQVFSQFLQQDYAHLYLRLHPACRWLKFTYPVYDIWCMCSDESEQANTINLDQAGCPILIFRRDYTIYLEKITDPEFLFLTAFANGFSLLAACQQALDSDPSFPLDVCSPKFVCHGLFVGIQSMPFLG